MIPVFESDELLSIILEWHEGTRAAPVIWRMSWPSRVFQTDEPFRIFVQALNTEDHIATWNTGAALLKGYEREDIIGKHFFGRCYASAPDDPNLIALILVSHFFPHLATLSPI